MLAPKENVEKGKTLLELAERCESATAEQQADLIADALRLVNDRSLVAREVNLLHAGAFVDAALTLVPEGWRIGQLEENWRAARWDCHVTQRPSPALIRAFDEGKTIGYDSKESEAATPALAICAAALRARQAME